MILNDRAKLGFLAVAALVAAVSAAAPAAAAETPEPSPSPVPPWDLTYLLRVDPSRVTAQDLYAHALKLEDEYQKYQQTDGIIWQGWYDHVDDLHPTGYGSGGDSAIFTGHYLVGAVYRALVTRDPKDLDPVLEALRGLHILTHVSGVPGVIARCAFPADQKEKWNYPDNWQGRIASGLVYESPENVPDILRPGQSYPKMIFYTKATRDQITGVLFGLAVAWAELQPERFAGSADAAAKVRKAREIVKTVTEAIWWRLRAKDFVLLDHHNKSGTNARKVSGILKLQLLALYREVLREGPDQNRFKRIDRKYKKQFAASFFLSDGSPADLFNRYTNLFQYYAWNLRFARAYSIYVLERDSSRRHKLRRFLEKHLWHYVKSHKNTHFTYVYNATRNPEDRHKLGEALSSLKSHSLRPKRCWSSPLVDRDLKPGWWKILFGDVSEDIVPPHLREPTTYFVWQKFPFDTGEGGINKLGNEGNTGMDFLLPYWMGRYWGFVPGP